VSLRRYITGRFGFQPKRHHRSGSGRRPLARPASRCASRSVSLRRYITGRFGFQPKRPVM
jgi:hypothetical protein